MSSPSQEGVILVKIPEERQQTHNDWTSPEKHKTYHNLLPPNIHYKKSLPTHATPIQLPTKTTHQSTTDYCYGKVTFHRYRFSSPYSPYNSFVSPGKAKQTYGKRRRGLNESTLSTFYPYNSGKNNSNTQKTYFCKSLLPFHDFSEKSISKDVSHISSPEKYNSDILNNNYQKAFDLRTPKHDNIDDSDLSSGTKPNHLLHTDSPKLLRSQPSSPDLSIDTENHDHEEINKVINTIEKSKFIKDSKTSLFNDNIKKKNEKENNIRILDIKNWWTGKFMEDSENMQLMLSKKGFALQKNGELLPQHNYNANEIRNIAYEFDQYGLLYIKLKSRNAKLNGPGTEYLIQIATTLKLKSLRILQYSCPEVDLIELTPDQAQKILSLKKSVNPSKRTDLSNYLIRSEKDDIDDKTSTHLDLKSTKTMSQTDFKTDSYSFTKDKKNNSKNEPRLIYPPVVLYDDDIERLNDGEFLNDTIIDFYLKYIQNKLLQNNPSKIEESHIFNTFFYKRLVDKDRFGKKGGYQNVKKWTSKTKINLFTKKYVVVPVNESLHWYVAIICNLDTMPSKPLIHDTDKSIQSSSSEKISPFFLPENKTFNNLSFDQNNENYNIYNNFSSFKNNEINEKKAKYKNININNQEDNTENSLKNSELSKLSENMFIKKVNEEYKKKPYSRILSKKKNISIRKPVIIIFDSLGGQHNITLRNLRDYLYEEAKDKQDLELNRADIAGIHAKVPQQSNYCDCGVFLLHYVEQFLNDPDRVLPFILNHDNETSISSDKDLWGQEKISSLRSNLRLLIKHLQNESFIPKRDTNNIYLNQENNTNDDHDSDELIMYF
ncbi:SUMO protease ULP2 [Pneumocystis jirovecii RU7]|uniref:Ubiquitin-like protease family profile domain-containing protein n=1 Tax=Pneumocystis jirovecii (strain RU7) TaxID=1408657 RepID=A0A0W4ZWD4_PNEJ7|nr:SUMO protease ULP2 [Pneumocystis jirovecii RU7]KTW32655.1 hypothetical protein T551_00140 [Pneumocystis jirovecii RU7]